MKGKIIQYIDQRGLSLIELLVYITVISMMLLLTSQFTIAMIKGQRRASEVQRVHQSVRHITTLLNYDFRQAQSVDTVGSVFDDDNGVLVIADPFGTTIRYQLTNNVLERQYGPDPVQAITTNEIDVEIFNIKHMEVATSSLNLIRYSLQMSAGFEGTDQFYRQTYVTSVTRR